MRSAYEINEIKHSNINEIKNNQIRKINQKIEEPKTFPIIALEMLTQSVPQIHSNAYNSTSHGGVVTTASDGQKTSPLALLAATCSSIGKNDNNDRHKITVAKSQGPPMHAVASDITKSSFKPYKSDIVSSVPSNTQGKPCHKPCSSSPPRHISPRRSNPDGENEKHLNRLHNDILPSDVAQIRDRHSMRSPHSSPMCPSSSAFFLPKAPPVGHSPYHGVCELGCTHCSTMRGLTEAPSPNPIHNRMLPICMCANCLQNRAANLPIPAADGLLPSSKLPTPLYPNVGNPYGPQSALKFGGSANGYPVGVCPDPHCYDCMKASHHHTGIHQSTLSGVGLKGYGPHVGSMLHPCSQDKSFLTSHMSANHRSPPNNCRSPRRPSVNTSVYNTYENIPIKTENVNPFVCNWVAEGKHCGKTFVSSEDLLQHLRTHTSQRQHNTAVSSVNIQGHSTSTTTDALPNQIGEPCSVHGCQCHLQPKLLRNTSYTPSPYAATHPYRFQPYGRPPITAPVPPNQVGFGNHSILHY